MHVVNTLEDARAVLQRALAAPEQQLQPCAPLSLCSPPYAACHAGVNYYRHLVDALAAEFPELPFTFTLCCGDDAAIAYDARRLGFTHTACTSPLDPAYDAAKP